MFYERTTPGGVITLDKGVAGSIIKREVSRFDGKILLSGPKSKYYKNETVDKLADDGAFFDMGGADGERTLRVYVVIKLGVSIGGVTEQLIKAISESIFELIGVKVCVSIIIKGVLSKNFSKREIEVNGK
ncbi:MAG: hypothetical protein LBL49_03760 [Clostridiales Family XIII bacterium]|jgi:uncharacterized alkaline shock family protein YloU|nr:hypothetical protein [Clostridiales Family XIII bacterium]